MNNINIKLHEYQKQILARLTGSISLRFNELILEGLESEHMNYHLKKLIEVELVQKEDDQYTLTEKGKDHVNMMNDEIEIIEKQPKSSVLLRAVKKDENGNILHLLNKKFRHPYFGKIGRVTGKIQFGETFEEAALRELYEETGLVAKSVTLEQVYHKLRVNEKGETVQDNIFYVMFLKDFTGEFLRKTKYQENFWLPTSAKDDPQFDFFDDIDLEERFEPKTFSFIEEKKAAVDY